MAEAAEAGSVISLVRSFLGSGKCLDMADSSSRTLLALCSGGGAGAGPGVGGGSQEQLAQWHSLAMSMHPGFLQHDWWNMDTVSSHTPHTGLSP